MGSIECCECLLSLQDDNQKREKEIRIEKSANEKKYPIGKNKLNKGFATLHLLTTIIYNYFNNDANKCEFVDCDDSIPILSHIILYGGSVRDLILNKSEINDIDITINTRELTKFQLIHLQKYHNTLQTQNNKVKCIFWRHYLNKFSDTTHSNILNEQILNSNTINEHDLINFNFRLMNTFSCNYVINAKWISEILINSNELKNKLDIKYFESISNETHTACFNMIIKQDLFYNNVNITGQDIDLFDPGHQFEHIFELENEKKSQYHINDSKNETMAHRTSITIPPYHFTKRLSMQNVLKLTINKSPITNKLIDIELPIHSTSVLNMLDRTDFSFNNVIISFNSIYENINVNNFNSLNVWKGMVQNGSEECESLTDIQNRVIRTAYKDPFKTIKYNFMGAQCFFFRIIKFGVRYYNEFTIDIQLVNAVIQTYDDWFNHKIMNTKKKCHEFCDRFVYGYVQPINDLKWNYDFRFKVMKDLQFHQRMINMINISQLFKDIFNEIINHMENVSQKQQFRQICIQYEYPIKLICDR